jgi:hypothetical protein
LLILTPGLGPVVVDSVVLAHFNQARVDPALSMSARCKTRLVTQNGDQQRHSPRLAEAYSVRSVGKLGKCIGTSSSGPSLRTLLTALPTGCTSNRSSGPGSSAEGARSPGGTDRTLLHRAICHRPMQQYAGCTRPRLGTCRGAREPVPTGRAAGVRRALWIIEASAEIRQGG